MTGFIGWWGSHVTQTDQVPTSHMILVAIVSAPFVGAWLWRHWNS